MADPVTSVSLTATRRCQPWREPACGSCPACVPSAWCFRELHPIAPRQFPPRADDRCAVCDALEALRG